MKKDIFHPVKKYRDNTPAKNIDVVQYFEKKSDTLENQNKALQEQNKVLESKVITLENKIVSSSPQNDLLIKEIKDLKEKVTVLENENKSLKQKLKDIVNLANEKIKSLFHFKIWNNYRHKQTRYDTTVHRLRQGRIVREGIAYPHEMFCWLHIRASQPHLSR